MKNPTIVPIDKNTQVDAPEISEEEFADSILFESDRALLVNKPGWLVCHPTKTGPGSSLIGAAKRYLQCDRLHLVSRLDRETSGIVVFAKDRGAARFLQMATEKRLVQKKYIALLEGVLARPFTVEGDLMSDRGSVVRVKMKVRPENNNSSSQVKTHFAPHEVVGKYTLCEVWTEGGRKHQIRVHALHAGNPLVGDKLYGKDESLYLEFCQEGWTSRLEQNMDFPRQALHCSYWHVENDLGLPTCHCPLPKDMLSFWESKKNQFNSSI